MTVPGVSDEETGRAGGGAPRSVSGRPLRFCMVTTFYPPYHFGGDAVFVHRLANELARRGHLVDVVHNRSAFRLLARRNPREGYRDHPNVRVHGLESRLGLLSTLACHQTGRPAFLASSLRRILGKNFDVIHYHNISLIGGPKVLEYGAAVKLYTAHEYWLICPTSTLFRFNREVCLNKACIRCLFLHRRPVQWWRYSGLLNRSLRHLDAFIPLTPFSRDIHLQRGLNLPSVELPFFLPPPLERESGEGPAESPPSKPYFLFAGRLEKLKGPQTLIPVFKRFPGAELWIAGAGRDEARMQRLAGGYPGIRFLGYQTYGRLRALYKNAAAVIVPSLFYEVSPLVLVEAFRERTPVIVRARGGMPAIVKESGGGLIYETEEELLAALGRLTDDKIFRDALGHQGYEAYLGKWTSAAHLERYLWLIAELAEKRGGRSEKGTSAP